MNLGTKWSLLGLAVEHDKPEIVKYLLSLGADPCNTSFAELKTPSTVILFARALTRIFREKEESETPTARTLKSIECAKLLVRVKHDWPVGLTMCDWHEPIVKPIEESKQYDLYAYLKAHGFLRHEPYDLGEEEAKNQRKAKKLQKANKQKANKIQMALHKRARLSQPPDVYVYSKTVIVQKDEEHREKVRQAYIKLNKIEWIQLIFKVLRAADGISMIVVDFDKNVAEIAGKIKGEATGLAKGSTKTVSIAGKVDSREDPNLGKFIDPDTKMCGTIAHELTHMAMQCIYENEMNPFYSGKPVPNGLKKAIKEAEKKVRKNPHQKNLHEDTCIGMVFDNYGVKDYPAEIIVRVPQLLAEYGEEMGKQIMVSKTPKLYNWYEEFVVEKCNSWLENNHKEEVPAGIQRSESLCSANANRTSRDASLSVADSWESHLTHQMGFNYQFKIPQRKLKPIYLELQASTKVELPSSEVSLPHEGEKVKVQVSAPDFLSKYLEKSSSISEPSSLNDILLADTLAQLTSSTGLGQPLDISLPPDIETIERTERMKPKIKKPVEKSSFGNPEMFDERLFNAVAHVVDEKIAVETKPEKPTKKPSL
ncbi:hypothetical protein ADUPG1_000496, partial [Aduncisulcus paluster]